MHTTFGQGSIDSNCTSSTEVHENHTVVSLDCDNVYHVSLVSCIKHTTHIHSRLLALQVSEVCLAQPCGHAVPSLFRNRLLPLRHQICRLVVTQRDTGGKIIHNRSAVTHMSAFCKVPLAGCRLKQLLRAHRRSQLGPSSQTALRNLFVSCRAYSEQVGVASTCCTTLGGCAPTLHIKSSDRDAVQSQVAKRPPRFYVPEKALQHSEPGAVFQLGKEETHHALK